MNQGQNALAPLTPFYKNELNNPQGFSPEELAAQKTASMQSLGGSQGGAVGQGNLIAARTGNSAGLGVALDQSARNNAKVGSGNALQVAQQNALLKQKQQQAGAQGLSTLGNEQTRSSLQSLGLSNQAIDAWLKGAQESSQDISKITAEIAAGLTMNPGAVAAAANGGTGGSSGNFNSGPGIGNFNG